MTLLGNSQIIVPVKEELVVEPQKSSVNTLRYLHWKTILAEFISTASLLFFGCMTCAPTIEKHLQPFYSSVGFGMIVVINIQAFGHLSEAHMNPCITLIAVIWRKMPVTAGIIYCIAQCAGSIVGYGLLISVTPIDLNGTCVTQPSVEYTILQTFSIELAFAMALTFVTCAIWDPVNKNSQECNSLKFGFTVVGLSLSGSALNGISMNPARSLGPALWTGKWRAHWIYWLGPLLGSGLIAIFYKFIWLPADKVVADEKSREDTLL